MQRAIRGLWVEWKPEIAPQATVMNMKLHTGVPLGCMERKLVHSSGMVYSGLTKIPMITPTAITIRQIPNRG